MRNNSIYQNVYIITSVVGKHMMNLSGALLESYELLQSFGSYFVTWINNHRMFLSRLEKKNKKKPTCAIIRPETLVGILET